MVTKDYIANEINGHQENKLRFILIFSKNNFLNPPVLVYQVFPFFELCSLQHRSFITFSVNIWKIEMSIFYTTAPSFFQFSGLSGFFYEANSLVNFVNVFFLCVQNRQKKTIQAKQLSIAGWYNEKNTFLREHSLIEIFWRIPTS